MRRFTHAKWPDGGALSPRKFEPWRTRAAAAVHNSLLDNGIYHIRLTATDVNGTSTSTTINVQVDGLAKIGVFTLSFTDITLPVGGIPITVTRTYDSRVKVKRDFGVGWSLWVAGGRFESNRAPGDGWSIYTAPFAFSLPCGQAHATKSHLTTVRISDNHLRRADGWSSGADLVLPPTDSAVEPLFITSEAPGYLARTAYPSYSPFAGSSGAACSDDQVHPLTSTAPQ